MKYSRWEMIDYLFFGVLLVIPSVLSFGTLVYLAFLNTPNPNKVVVDAPSFKGEATLLDRSSNTITVEIDGKTRVFSGTFSYEYQMVD